MIYLELFYFPSKLLSHLKPAILPYSARSEDKERQNDHKRTKVGIC